MLGETTHQGRRIASPLAMLVVCLLASISTLSSNVRPLELNTDPDDAAHYVTAAMISAYVADGGDTAPRAFAERYYLHYPKVAFGIWPPLFHMALGGWMVIAGVSIPSALMFMALTTTAVAFIMFQVSRESLGLPLALAMVVWFATLPAIQVASSSVMMDTLCTLFMVVATVCFGRYLDSEKTKFALGFAVLAALAMLTKYNALALAVLPPFAIVVSGRWAVVRRINFWAMPVVVAAICAPWYLAQWGMVRYAADPVPPPGYALFASKVNLGILRDEVGIAGLAVAALGVYALVVRRRNGNGVWCSMLALAVATWLFHSVAYPIFGARYLLASIVGLVLFAAGGSHYLATRIAADRGFDAKLTQCVVAAGLAALALATWHPMSRQALGYAEVAELVLDRGVPPDSTTLVSSGGIGEGAVIAHIATRELQPPTIVLRGSKLLSKATWMETTYTPTHSDAAAVLATLQRARVQYVIVDDQFDRPHHRLLEQAVRESDDWTLLRKVASSPTDDALNVSVYGRVKPLPPGKPDFELNTVHSLGYDVDR